MPPRGLRRRSGRRDVSPAGAWPDIDTVDWRSTTTPTRTPASLSDSRRRRFITPPADGLRRNVPLGTCLSTANTVGVSIRDLLESQEVLPENGDSTLQPPPSFAVMTASARVPWPSGNPGPYPP